MTRTPLAALADNDAETIVRSTYFKVIRHTARPYKVLEIQENTFVIYKDINPNTVSIDLVNPVVRRNEEATDVRKERPERNNKRDHENSQQQPDKTIKRTTGRSVQEYTVDQIVRRVMREDELH